MNYDEVKHTKTQIIAFSAANFRRQRLHLLLTLADWRHTSRVSTSHSAYFFAKPASGEKLGYDQGPGTTHTKSAKSALIWIRSSVRCADWLFASFYQKNQTEAMCFFNEKLVFDESPNNSILSLSVLREVWIIFRKRFWHDLCTTFDSWHDL